jgi:hypothetical protein
MNSARIISFVAGSILMLFSAGSFGQEENIRFGLNGFTDTYHAVRSSEPYDWMSSRTRLRTEFSATKDRSYMFASLNAVYNSVIEEQTLIELREAFFQYTGDHWDLKAGRQIVIWGVSDGLRITDLVSPLDMTEFLARDYDDIRLPVDAVRLKYFNTKLSVEAIFIPVSSFFILPSSPGNPWSIFPTSGEPVYEVNMDNYPDKTLKNSEYGGRLSLFLSGVDFSLSYLHTWNKMPVFARSFSTNYDTIFVDSQHHRLNMLGGDFSFPVRQFVVRGEVAEYFGEIQESSSGEEKIMRNTTNFLLGLDWYPGHEWTITAQYSHKLIPDYVDEIESRQNTVLGTLGITKRVFRSLLSLSTFMYYDASNDGFFSRTSADYSLSDEIHLLTGYDWFEGDEGIFGLYNHNSEFWFKAKFSF